MSDTRQAHNHFMMPTLLCHHRTSVSSRVSVPRPARASRRGLAVRAGVSENADGVTRRNNTTVHKLVDYFGAITIPGCYDALSAKILQQAGHQAALVSGAAVSATQLGEPDLGLLTAPEMVRRTTQICNSVPTFPVIADIESGGGGVLNVQRTVKSLIQCGARGCIIEDQAGKRMGHGARSLVPAEEFISKIAAAREVIGESDFFLVARTDARSASAKRGLEDAIIRANLYCQAGADAHVVGGLRSVDELRIVGENTVGLRVANMVEGGVTPICSTAQLQEMGFHIACYPLSSLYAATRALVEVYGGLAATGTSQHSWEDMVSWRAFQDILGLEERYSSEEHFKSVQGPSSSIEQRLRAKVKGVVREHKVEG